MVGTDPEKFHDARLILLWGTNIISSNLPPLARSRRRAAVAPISLRSTHAGHAPQTNVTSTSRHYPVPMARWLSA